MSIAHSPKGAFSGRLVGRIARLQLSAQQNAARSHRPPRPLGPHPPREIPIIFRLRKMLRGRGKGERVVVLNESLVPPSPLCVPARKGKPDYFLDRKKVARGKRERMVERCAKMNQELLVRPSLAGWVKCSAWSLESLIAHSTGPKP
jgi:hypothetical protein